MKLNITILSLASAALCLTACDQFLDVMPDNRTEIDSQKKVRTLITSAYPETDYLLLSEFMSDNVDDFGPENPNSDRFIDQVFHWEEITETANDDPESLWGNSYIAIASANQAIQSINDMGGAEKAGLQAEMAEALLCRAYNHFILVNMFAQAYNGETSATDLGVTYMQAPETELNPKYERNTVAEVYELIDKDLQEALPWVSDAYYSIPKYHFNQKSAYAFAARFYLYYEKWDKAIEYANKALGSQPSAMLRDWKYIGSMVQDEDVVMNHFIDASLNANMMLLTAYSNFGVCFDGRYSHYAKYAHGNYIATYEDGIALASLLGKTNAEFYYSRMFVYKATNHDKTIFWKIPYLFEMTDPVAQIGYSHIVYPAFTGDQLLLERAEAKILTKDYEGAAQDMNIWLNNISKVTWDLSVDDIDKLIANVKTYSSWDNSTVKKVLNPKFDIEKGGLQENMLHFVLLLKRVDGLHQGLRWFDVKRYGIEIQRRIIGSDGLPESYVDVLSVGDSRRALQIPRKVIDAGYTPNPRNESTKEQKMFEPVL